MLLLGHHATIILKRSRGSERRQLVTVIVCEKQRITIMCTMAISSAMVKPLQVVATPVAAFMVHTPMLRMPSCWYSQAEPWLLVHLNIRHVVRVGVALAFELWKSESRPLALAHIPVRVEESLGRVGMHGHALRDHHPGPSMGTRMYVVRPDRWLFELRATTPAPVRQQRSRVASVRLPFAVRIGGNVKSASASIVLVHCTATVLVIAGERVKSRVVQRDVVEHLIHVEHPEKQMGSNNTCSASRPVGEVRALLMERRNAGARTQVPAGPYSGCSV